MRKLIAPIILIVMIVAFCSVCVWRTEQICTEAADLLEAAEQFAVLEDYEHAELLTRKSQQMWVSREGFLGMVLRHTESDDICYMYPTLLDCCNERNIEEYCMRNHELQAYLRQLYQMEIPYYFNVL